MTRRKLALVTVLVIGLLVSTTVATFTGSAHATPQRVEADTCLKVSSGLLSSLRSGLKRTARGKLGTPRAVKSRAQITSGPRGFAEGAYFVSARVRGFGIATWAADARAFRTGGGFITGIGPVARRVSVLGVDIPVSTLRGWGLTEATHGYAASRRCVQ
jgi:hypothetical protein